jgi:hypothetical protein
LIASNFDGGITLFSSNKTVGVMLNVGVSWAIQFIWGFFNDLSFLTILSLVSINVPGLAKIIQGALIGFICMDLLQTDRWLAPLIFNEGTANEGEDNEDEALNQYFDENGFSTKVLIKNLGSTFVYIVIYCLILLMIPILKILGGKINR